MKGLLKKDLCLLKGQKKALLVMVILAVFYTVILDGNAAFWLGYFVLMTVTITTSTISYDEFDNGYPYLFTLPVTRKGYVREKYLFSVTTVTAACMVGFALELGMLAVKDAAMNIGELTTEALIMLALGILMLSFSLPVHLKYGAEKGRVMIFMGYVALAAIILLPGYLAQRMGLDVLGLLVKVENFSPSVQGTVVIAAAVIAVILWISLSVSYRILERKEF